MDVLKVKNETPCFINFQIERECFAKVSENGEITINATEAQIIDFIKKSTDLTVKATGYLILEIFHLRNGKDSLY